MIRETIKTIRGAKEAMPVRAGVLTSTKNENSSETLPGRQRQGHLLNLKLCVIPQVVVCQNSKWRRRRRSIMRKNGNENLHHLHRREIPNPNQVEQIADHYRQILRLAGFNPEKGDLARTPLRVAKAFLEMTAGHRTTIDSQMSIFEKECERSSKKCSNMLIVQDIPFVSLCEHHLLPFFGVVSIGYVPNRVILGLSKFTRIVKFFARRLQSQERMAHNIADFVEKLLKPMGVAVVINARHTCSSGRGVEDHVSVFKVDVMRGIFLRNPMTRGEFLARISTPVHHD